MSRASSAMLVRISFALVRQWTRFYTLRMPAAARADRLKEIESDLSESVRDEQASASLPMQVIVRLALGMPDDLRWRAEQPGGVQTARLTFALVASAALLGAIWVSVAAGGESPQPPPAPDLRWRPKHPPPPPPPPPPPFDRIS